MKRYKIGAAIKSAGAYKSKGITVCIIVQYLIALLSEVLKDEGLGLTEEQMERIMDAFIAKLPYEFRLCLQPELAA